MNWSDNIQVFNEDCMEVMKRYPDNYFDLAVVDPPYGIGASDYKRGGTQYGKAKCKSYAPKEWDNSPPPPEYFNELFRVSRDQIIWGANHFLGKNSSCFLVWDKLNGVGSGYADAELAYTSFKKAVRVFRFRWAGMLQHDMKNKEVRMHPTQKPVALYAWIYHNYAKPDFKILDTHGGSFSSAIAWHRYSKGQGEFVGVELDQEYYDAAYKRFKEQTAQLTLL